MSKYDIFFDRKFNEKEGWLGNDLINALTKQFNLTSQTARKALQRARECGKIWSSKPLTFSKGQYYYFLPHNKPDRIHIKELMEKLRPPVYRLLELLDQCDGIISFYEALKITASPDDSATTKVSRLMDIVDDLAKFKIVVERKDSNKINYILNRLDREDCEDKYNELIYRHQEQMQLDTIFNTDLMKWLFEINLITSYGNYRSTLTPGLGVEHNNLYWDAIGYSRTTGYYTTGNISNNKQTLVVIDSVLSRSYSYIDLMGFLARIQVNENSVAKIKRKVIPVIFYHTIDDKTRNTARKLGFLIYSLTKIYGSVISKVLEDVNSIFKRIKENNTVTIEETLKKINDSGQNAKLTGLRGALFESLMRPVLENLYPNAQIDPGKILKDPEKKNTREFDYIIISSNPKEQVFVELKGYSGNSYIRLGETSGKTKNTLRYFFRGSLPIGEAYYKQDNSLQNHSSKAVFISTGHFHSECKQFIDTMNSSKCVPSKIGKCILDGEALISILKANNYDHEIKVIKQYFMEINEDSFN